MQSQRNIVAIGGGQVFVPCRPPQTLAIDEHIVALAKANLALIGESRKPRILFVPTASGDDLGYCNAIYTLFELRLGCSFDHLRILAENLTNDVIRARIDWADIIYVGGGNTYRMIRAWRRRGIDQLLKNAYDAGTVMCGLSAGAICWFDAGISDSRKKPGRKDWQPILVKGLGLIPAACCPHYDSEGDWRQPACEERLWRQHDLRLIALEDLCAIQITDGLTYRVLSPTNNACRLMFWDEGSIISEEISEGDISSWFEQ